MRSLARRLRAALSPLLVTAGLGAAACEPARAGAPPPESDVPAEASSTSSPPSAPPSPPSPQAAQAEPANLTVPPATPIDKEPLPFLDWAVSHCHIDELMPSAYTLAWHRYKRPPDLLGPGDPHPLRVARTLPREGSAAAKEQAAALREAWLKSPQSHVIDCSLPIQGHRCLGCPPETVAHAYYIAYLPAALSSKPETARSVLFLVPGGNGGRTRPFMRPIPGRSVYDRGSGGLDTKLLADTFYAAHPDASQALIVALETSGIELEGGSVEHIARRMPSHVAATFLPHLAEGDLIRGAEGVSSGAREIVRAAFKDPAAFHTVGLSCMACGGIHPRTARLAGAGALRAFADALATRKREGVFDVRFAIGSRDGQLPCNRAYRDLFLERGVLSGSDAGAFTVVEGEKHDFNFLRRSYPAELEWHLTALDRIARRAVAAPSREPPAAAP